MPIVLVETVGVGPGRGRGGRRRPTPRWSWSTRDGATRSRPTRPACWRSPTSSSSTRPIGPGAAETRRDLDNMLDLTSTMGEWRPPIVADRGRHRRRRRGAVDGHRRAPGLSREAAASWPSGAGAGSLEQCAEVARRPGRGARCAGWRTAAPTSGSATPWLAGAVDPYAGGGRVARKARAVACGHVRRCSSTSSVATTASPSSASTGRRSTPSRPRCSRQLEEAARRADRRSARRGGAVGRRADLRRRRRHHRVRRAGLRRADRPPVPRRARHAWPPSRGSPSPR